MDIAQPRPVERITEVRWEEAAMFNNLGPIDIHCDAPAYSVVGACERLGFQSPLDVRWCRMSHFLAGRHQASGVEEFHSLGCPFGSNRPPTTTCRCGQPLPLMEHCTFRFISEKEAHYLLGQCRRCHTMFWEEAPVPGQEERGGGCWGR